MKSYTALAQDLTDGNISIDPAERKVQVRVLHQRLLAPFPRTEHEVRPATHGQKSKPLFYVDPRAYTKRLDMVLGLDGYSSLTPIILLEKEMMAEMEYNKVEKKREQVGVKEGLMSACVVSIEVHHPLFKKTVSNIGEKSIIDMTAENKSTSAYAQAFKRAATHLGIAAYLYYISMPDQPYDKSGRGFGFQVPPDTVMEEALRNVGFKGICEKTGKKVTWNEAAVSMHYHGRVLCEAETRRLLEEETPTEG